MVATGGRVGLGLPIRAPTSGALPGCVALLLALQTAQCGPRSPTEVEASNPMRSAELGTRRGPQTLVGQVLHPTQWAALAVVRGAQSTAQSNLQCFKGALPQLLRRDIRTT
ncbi:hypothetical protein NDU88_005271 [Pleurodeles waltl]|uniref:Secreted protein n=1 Tax=Pleurodeles waltl TaxID=8319 RepID=A0AAV7UHL4_PLEWA|nr:hypothetical protein NDU88_005271 [Pleurodeles waltl]